MVEARGPRWIVKLVSVSVSVKRFGGSGVSCVLCQRARGHAASAWPGGDGHAWAHVEAVVLDGVAVAAHAPFVAVEDGGFDEIGVLGPVPVGLVSFVGAFCAQGGFVRPDVVAVPVHKVCCCMYGWGHVHVDNCEVVITRLCAWILASRKFRRRCEDAFDCSEVLSSLVLGKITTDFVSSVLGSVCTCDYYSLRTATVFLLHVETRFVSPSSSVLSRTL
jgi:hypothetical protein